MAVKNIIKYGDPLLRKKMPTIINFDILPEIVQDMFDTMYEEEGMGLAANQIGIDMNLMVIDITHTDEMDEPMVCVNGMILKTWGEETVVEEGCLSLPGIRLDIPRPENVKFRFQDINGKKVEKEFNGLLARVIQHEMDHLNGKLIIDRIPRLVRNQYKKQLKKIVEEYHTSG